MPQHRRRLPQTPTLYDERRAHGAVAESVTLRCDKDVSLGSCRARHRAMHASIDCHHAASPTRHPRKNCYWVSTEVNFAATYKEDFLKAINQVDLDKVELATSWLRQARDEDRHIFTCGNGGSASTASHFVCDVVKGASYQKAKRFRIMALTDSLPTITAYSNDVDYSCVFAEQLKNFAGAGDVLVAISGSGNSPNVVTAAEYARSVGCKTIGLTGRDGGKLGKVVELNIQVPVQHMGRIEDAHLIICHMMAYELME
jgi:D-sedoheptulose 7-phosphate isomerase